MKKTARLLALLLVAVSLLSVLGACAGTSGDATTASGSGATTAAPATTQGATAAATVPASQAADKPDTLVIAYQLEFKILDPFNTGSSADSAINASIYDSLLAMDVYGNAYPLVAKDWSVSDDGTVYTFNLRDDVTFHDGSKLTANDIDYSFNRMKESAFRTNIAALIDHVNVVDDYTVEFVLHDVTATFLMEIASQFTCYSESATEAGGATYQENPVGCGPYKFVSMKSNEVVLQAYEGYYGDPAPIKNLIYKVIPEGSTALMALENGEVDVCDYVPAASYSIVENNPDLYLLRSPYTRLMQLILNVTKAPFDNQKVRQAMGYAIDKELLIAATLGGYGTPAYGQINDRYIGYTPELDQYGFTYDPDKSKALLEEAGYPGGAGLPPIKLQTLEMFKKQVEMVQAMLKDVGVNVEIEILELSAYLDTQANGDLHAALMSWTGGPDASIYERQLTAAGNFNGAVYHNDDIARLLKESLRELDGEKRKQIFLELFKIELEEAPYIPLYFPDTITCGRKDLNFAVIREYLIFKGSYYYFE